jgi:soluble lytic murein transglycosylase-like protein
MSLQALGATTVQPPDVATAVSRVAAIEQLIAQAADGFAASAPSATQSSATAGFSSVLASAASAASTSTADGADGNNAYAPIIDAAASSYGLDPAILTGLVNQESGFDPNAVSSAGAEGLTQVMPENFAADGITNPFDPTQSIYGGAKQLSEDLAEFNGNYSDALAAYNAGSAAVQEYGGVPPYQQTQNYVADILSYAQSAGQQQSAEQTLPTSFLIPTTTGADIE